MERWFSRLSKQGLKIFIRFKHFNFRLPRKEPRILLDAEVLVRLAYLTITGETEFKNLETLRLAYEQGGGQTVASEATLEGSLELTPIEDLRRFFEETLGSSNSLKKE